MNDVDSYYEEAYTLPLCSRCGTDSLAYKTYMVYKVKLFCAKVGCPAFMRTFWVDKKDLVKR